MKNGYYTGIDLFAGAGGFTLAAKEVGIHVKAAIEFDRHACETYRRNFIYGQENPPELIEDDINEVDPYKLLKLADMLPGECDVLMGGPPCQGFSTHRIKGAGVDDPRNTLIIKYFDFVKIIEPKVFVIENVSGLLWPRHADYLNKFLKLAKKSGYSVYGPTLLNAKDYGVPQNRERVFIIGISSSLPLKLDWPPQPTHYNPKSEEVKKDEKTAWINAKVVFKPLSKKDPNLNHMNHTERIIEVFKSTPKNGGSRLQSNRTLPCHENYRGHLDVYGRIDPRKPGPTITTGCINPSKGRFVHPTKNHGITIRHAARFQTFPDDFIFEGGLMASGRQIGNAVPIRLGVDVFNTVIQALDEYSPQINEVIIPEEKPVEVSV